MKKTTKKMVVGGFASGASKVATQQAKAAAQQAKAAKKVAPAKPAPTIAQKAAPIANAAMGALSKMKFNAGGMAKKKKC
jgi:hypothetical protein